jgi:hypothetical protein
MYPKVESPGVSGNFPPVKYTLGHRLNRKKSKNMFERSFVSTVGYSL